MRRIFGWIGALVGATSMGASPVQKAPEHAVIVHFTYGSTSLDRLFELERELEGAISSAGVGEYDGNEVAVDGSDGYLYMYGQDADKLFEAIRPILERASFMRGAEVRKRYGPPQDGVRESVIRIAPLTSGEKSNEDSSTRIALVCHRGVHSYGSGCGGAEYLFLSQGDDGYVAQFVGLALAIAALTGLGTTSKWARIYCSVLLAFLPLFSLFSLAVIVTRAKDVNYMSLLPLFIVSVLMLLLFYRFAFGKASRDAFNRQLA